jgi:hypothetical protein
MADTSQTRLAYIAETTWGTTPATPAFTNARFTGEGLSPNIDNITSNEIREDRNVTDLIQVGQSSGGTVDFELSYGAFDDWLESVLYGTWATNVLINGNTENSFTIEKTFETGATGKGASTDQAIITGATYTPGPSNPVINAATNFANLAITGVTSPEVTAINLNVTNNLRTQKVLGSLDARGIGTGRFEVTGDLTAYFENEELFDLYLNGTSADLSFKLGGASSLNYVFDMGTIKFETGEVLAGGNDQDLLAVMTFRDLFDGVDNTLKITRTP